MYKYTIKRASNYIFIVKYETLLMTLYGMKYARYARYTQGKNQEFALYIFFKTVQPLLNNTMHSTIQNQSIYNLWLFCSIQVANNYKCIGPIAKPKKYFRSESKLSAHVFDSKNVQQRVIVQVDKNIEHFSKRILFSHVQVNVHTSCTKYVYMLPAKWIVTEFLLGQGLMLATEYFGFLIGTFINKSKVIPRWKKLTC